MAFEFFPLLEGKLLNYQEYFTVIGFLFFFIFGVLFLLAYQLIAWIHKCFFVKPTSSSASIFDSERGVYNTSQNSQGYTNIKPYAFEKRSIVPMTAVQGKDGNIYAPQGVQPVYSSQNMQFFTEEPVQPEVQNKNEYNKHLDILNWLGAVFIALSVIPFSAMSYVSVWKTIPAFIAIVLLKYFYNIVWIYGPDVEATLPPLPNNDSYFMKVIKHAIRTIHYYSTVRTSKFHTVITVIAVVGYLLGNYTANMCLSFYNPEQGIVFPTVKSLTMSTEWSRHFHGEVCPPGEPCHVYITLPNNASTGVFVNFHIGDMTCTEKEGLSEKNINCQPMVYFDTVPHKYIQDYKYVQTPVQTPYKAPEKRAERTLYAALLNNLQPNTVYSFVIYYKAIDYTSAIYRVKTLPADGTTIRMVSGGDVGNMPFALEMSKVLATYDPDLIIIGGDIAYDNNIAHCYAVWDTLLNRWKETLVTSKGYLIPTIFGIGNHDVGMNTQSGHHITFTEEGPHYILYFPQHFPSNYTSTGQEVILREDVPTIQERHTYFYHLINNNIVLLSLDAGYVADFGGAQAAWINATFNQFSYLPVKYVHYHDPIYSSCGDNNVDKKHYMDALLFWVPLFDYHGLTVSFENHVHAAKRTVPMVGNMYNPQGTIYTGDGLWGVSAIECQQLNTDPMFVFVAKDNHIWLVDIGQQSSSYFAITIDNVILNQFAIDHYNTDIVRGEAPVTSILQRRAPRSDL